MSSQQQSLEGRAGKLLGRAGAAQFRKGDGSKFQDGQSNKPIPGVARTPESFVFEGYRASAKNGKPKDLKLGGNGGGKKGKGKPRTRSSKRGTEWKKKGAK
jgi:nucleolar protein 12